MPDALRGQGLAGFFFWVTSIVKHLDDLLRVHYVEGVLPGRFLGFFVRVAVFARDFFDVHVRLGFFWIKLAFLKG
jgi:hypothetical protein